MGAAGRQRLHRFAGIVRRNRQDISVPQLCHAHNRAEFRSVIDPNGIPESVRKTVGLSKLVGGPGI
jgi:hypothetical protein